MDEASNPKIRDVKNVESNDFVFIADWFMGENYALLERKASATSP